MALVLQIFASVFMIGALALMALSIKSGNYQLAAINIILFAINAGIFYVLNTRHRAL